MVQMSMVPPTTMCLSFKYRYLGHNFCFDTQTPVSNYTSRKLSVCLSFQTTTKRNVGSAGVLFTSSHEPFKKTRVQELVDLMHQCAEECSLADTKAVHGHILKCNFDNDNLLVLLNHVIHAYSKCSDFGSARLVFNTMSQKNVFSWTVIAGCSENGMLYDSFKYFCKMQECGIEVDAFAFSAILQSCVGLNRLDLGEMVHAQIIIRGFISNVFVSTSLLTMYTKLGEVEHSLKVFNNMNEHNNVSWNAMISGFSANGLYLEAFDHFLIMMKNGFSPDIYSFISVLKAVGMLGDAGKGKQVHKYASELDLESHVHVGTALIDMYSKCGALADARSVFDQRFSSQFKLNMPWNAMIGGYSECKHSQEALDLYVEMCQKNVKSDVYTYCSIFDAIADLKCSQFLREVHAMVLKSGCDSVELSIANAIAYTYSKCASLEDVRKFFDRMKQRDLVSWTVLVGAYCQCSEWEEAITVFFQMREESYTPNEFTFSTILTACAGLCSLELGQQIHGLLYKSGLHTDNCTNSALLDMYAKCGCLIEARKVFDCISRPDIVSWTAIISGYAQHGYVTHALQLFRRMEYLNIRANAVTLLCVLFACSHAGVVEEGLQCFWSMKERYGLKQEMEHYVCIVDLLGRIGHLSQAFQFIKAMPVEPDEMVWQTLLAACRIHGNIELGEISAKKIFSILPEYSAAYVLLSNTYMERGSFRDGLKLRRVMKQQGVKKEPGYSSISLKGRVHTFYAGDQKHPQKDEIYLKLAELRKMLKIYGYVPDIRFALQSED